MKSVLAILIFWFSSLGAAGEIDTEQVDQLTNIMMKGCSVGQDVSLSINGDGSVQLLKKGVSGGISASRSEIPSIVKFMESDASKGNQTNESRKCIERYMNKIFDAILLPDVESRIEDIDPIVEHGIIYELLGCAKEERNNVECRFEVTSTLQDRVVLVSAKGGTYSYPPTTMYDQNNNEYKASIVSIANHTNKKSYAITNVRLVADVPAPMSIHFKNVSTNINKITLLELFSESKLNDSKNKSYVRFKNLPIQ